MKARIKARRLARQLEEDGWPWRAALVEAGRRVAESNGRYQRPGPSDENHDAAGPGVATGQAQRT